MKPIFALALALTACATTPHASPKKPRFAHLGSGASAADARVPSSPERLPPNLYGSLDRLCSRDHSFNISYQAAVSPRRLWPTYAKIARTLRRGDTQAVVLPFLKPAGASLVLFADDATMNLVLGRPTTYLMEDNLLRDHQSMVDPEERFLGVVGHDLEESLLRRYAGAFATAEASFPLPAENAKLLCKERKFWRTYLGPRLEQPDYAILIGASLEEDSGESTVSHELLHAVFYSDERVQQLVKEFWEGQVAEADREGMSKALRDEAYDIDHNQKMLYNEVLAYLLERQTEEPLFGEWRPAYAQKLREQLEGHGIELP